jgi:hypothetical protein
VNFELSLVDVVNKRVFLVQSEKKIAAFILDDIVATSGTINRVVVYCYNQINDRTISSGFSW